MEKKVHDKTEVLGTMEITLAEALVISGAMIMAPAAFYLVTEFSDGAHKTLLDKLEGLLNNFG